MTHDSCKPWGLWLGSEHTRRAAQRRTGRRLFGAKHEHDYYTSLFANGLADGSVKCLRDGEPIEPDVVAARANLYNVVVGTLGSNLPSRKQDAKPRGSISESDVGINRREVVEDYIRLIAECGTKSEAARRLDEDYWHDEPEGDALKNLIRKLDRWRKAEGL